MGTVTRYRNFPDDRIANLEMDAADAKQEESRYRATSCR